MKILVLVDLQEDFINGSLGTPEAQTIVPKVVDKLRNYPDKGNTLLLYTKDTHKKNYLETFEGKRLPVEHCIENTPGWCINKEIASWGDNNDFLYCSCAEVIKSRIYKSTFGSDILRDLLIEYQNEIEEIEFVGLCTDICVISNVLMARQALPNVKITVDASCCAGTTLEAHKAALLVMKSCQIDVINE